VLRSAHRAVISERRDVAVNRDAGRILLQLQQVGPVAEQLVEPLWQPRRRRTLQQLPAAEVSDQPISEYPSASCVISRETCVDSATSDLRNLRRAGRLKNRSATSMQVPSRVPTSRAA